MKTKNIKKVLLLVAITLLLVGLVSAATANKTSTSKDTKIVKDTTKTSVKTATKTVKEPAKKVTNNTIKKKLTQNKLNQAKKTEGSKTYDVSDFDTLHSALTSYQYDQVNINIKSDITLTDSSQLSTSIKTLNINGNGKTIDGNKKYQFLTISQNNKVTLNNVKITNCNAYSGGAIYNTGSLTISNSLLNNNYANTSAGAIYNKGTMIIQNSILNNNTGNGEQWDSCSGAIRNCGNLTIKNSKLNNNKAAYDGGAIYNENRCNLSILNSTLNNNAATNAGGAIRNCGNLTIKNSKLNNNKAGYNGGTIFNGYSNNDTVYLTITNSILNNNTAHDGGAIHNWPYGLLTITDSTLSNNKAIWNGGAICNYGGTTNIKNNKLNTNKAEENGGAIYNIENGTSTIKGNLFKENKAKSTGSAIINNGNAVIKNNTNDKTSIDSGTIYNEEAKVTVTNNIFDDGLINTKITLKLNNTKPYLGSKVKATITLKDEKEKILENQKITIKFGSDTYTVKTNSKGIATKVYKTTTTGKINVTSTFAGIKKFKKSTKTITMKVLPKVKTKLTLKLSKSKVKVKDKIKITATLKNKSNKAIKNQKVAIKIGSKTYNKKTNSKGTITFTYKVVKSALGKAIKATYKGNYMYLSSKASEKLLKA